VRRARSCCLHPPALMSCCWKLRSSLAACQWPNATSARNGENSCGSSTCSRSSSFRNQAQQELCGCKMRVPGFLFFSSPATKEKQSAAIGAAACEDDRLLPVLWGDRVAPCTETRLKWGVVCCYRTLEAHGRSLTGQLPVSGPPKGLTTGELCCALVSQPELSSNAL